MPMLDSTWAVAAVEPLVHFILDKQGSRTLKDAKMRFPAFEGPPVSKVAGKFHEVAQFILIV